MNHLPHDGGIEEIILMIDAGFSPVEAIHAATGVLVGGDVAADITAIRTPRLVMRAGPVVHRAG